MTPSGELALNNIDEQKDTINPYLIYILNGLYNSPKITCHVNVLVNLIFDINFCI